MKRGAITFAYGDRQLSVPSAALIGLMVLAALASLYTLGVHLLPASFTASGLPVLPEPFDTIAIVLAYLTALMLLLWAITVILGMAEGRHADRRFTDIGKLVDLASEAAATLTLAPNLPEAEQLRLLEGLARLSREGAISAAFLSLRECDLADGSVDRLFVSSELPAKQFRHVIRGLTCDGADRVPERLVAKLQRAANFGAGTIWLLTWD